MPSRFKYCAVYTHALTYTTSHCAAAAWRLISGRSAATHTLLGSCQAAATANHSVKLPSICHGKLHQGAAKQLPWPVPSLRVAAHDRTVQPRACAFRAAPLPGALWVIPSQHPALVPCPRNLAWHTRSQEICPGEGASHAAQPVQPCRCQVFAKANFEPVGPQSVCGALSTWSLDSLASLCLQHLPCPYDSRALTTPGDSRAHPPMLPASTLRTCPPVTDPSHPGKFMPRGVHTFTRDLVKFTP